MNEKQDKLPLVVATIILLVILALFYPTYRLIADAIKHYDFKITSLEKTDTLKEQAKQSGTTSKTAAKYSASALRNPTRRVMIAELNLSQENIDQARAAVKAHGGADTEAFNKRLDIAQKEHGEFVNKRVKVEPKSDVIIDNPDTKFDIPTYYGEQGMYEAYTPDFDQYSRDDIEKKWGTPDHIINSEDTIRKNIDTSNRESEEAKYLREIWQTGTLSWREAKLYNLWLTDLYYGGHFSEEWIYHDQGKPNVIFDDQGKIAYVTPVFKYVLFPRNGEKYPDKGFSSYPYEYPQVYQFPKGPVSKVEDDGNE
jgi:hypothetical protein